MEHPNDSWVHTANFQHLSLLPASSQLSHRDADHVFRALQMSPALTGMWEFIGILSKGTGQGLTARAHPIFPGRSRAGGTADTPSPRHWVPPWRWKWAGDRMGWGSVDEPGRAGAWRAAEQPCYAVAG